MLTQEERNAEAAERLRIIREANALNALIESEGWRLMYDFQVAALEQSRQLLRKVDTGDRDHAIDALQKWQIAENMLEAQVTFINRTLDEAAQIRGVVTVDDALLMEKLNEQSKPAGDSGGAGADPAGY